MRTRFNLFRGSEIIAVNYIRYIFSFRENISEAASAL